MRLLHDVCDRMGGAIQPQYQVHRATIRCARCRRGATDRGGGFSPLAAQALLVYMLLCCVVFAMSCKHAPPPCTAGRTQQGRARPQQSRATPCCLARPRSCVHSPSAASFLIASQPLLCAANRLWPRRPGINAAVAEVTTRFGTTVTGAFFTEGKHKKKQLRMYQKALKDFMPVVSEERDATLLKCACFRLVCGCFLYSVLWVRSFASRWLGQCLCWRRSHAHSSCHARFSSSHTRAAQQRRCDAALTSYSMCLRAWLRLIAQAIAGRAASQRRCRRTSWSSGASPSRRR